MPELPEVETIRLSLSTHLSDGHVLEAKLFRKDYANQYALKFEEMILPTSVLQFVRKGKQLAIHFDSEQSLIIHLGMSGRFYFASPEQVQSPPKHLHFSITINQRPIFLVDPRRFGSITFIASSGVEKFWQKLGPDALDISLKEMKSRLSIRRSCIKNVLLNQSVVAGLGNIYVDEILFESKVNPCQPSHTVSTSKVEKIHKSMRRILKTAIRRGGSTLRDHISATGDAGSYQNLHRAYGRAGLPCLICGTEMVGFRLHGRQTVYCPECTKD